MAIRQAIDKEGVPRAEQRLRHDHRRAGAARPTRGTRTSPTSRRTIRRRPGPPLEGAGYGDGLDVTLTWPNIYPVTNAEFVASQLAEVGINVDHRDGRVLRVAGAGVHATRLRHDGRAPRRAARHRQLRQPRLLLAVRQPRGAGARSPTAKATPDRTRPTELLKRGGPADLRGLAGRLADAGRRPHGVDARRHRLPDRRHRVAVRRLRDHT